MTVADDLVTLRYHATAQTEGQDAYHALCRTTYRSEPGGLKLIEHRQHAL